MLTVLESGYAMISLVEKLPDFFVNCATSRPLPEMLAFFFAFLKDLALEFAFSHFSGICTKNRIFRQLSQLPILFLCGSTCFGWHSYL